MGGKTLAFVWLGVWAVAYALSFIIAANTAAKDMGFTRGLNRVTSFLGWQAAATVVAIIVWGYVRQFEAGTFLCWVFRVPGILAGTLLAFLLFMVVSANITKLRPASEVPMPSKPVTAPVSPVQMESKPYSGYYRQGFEQSDFYTLDGDGPYWLDAEADVWGQLQSHLVPKPGRGSSVTVKLTVEGDMETGGKFGHLESYNQRFHARRILEIERLTSEEYDTIIQGFHDARNRVDK